MDEPVDRKTSRCNRQLVAAIDFGTTYSGYAYSFKHEWTKVITNHWHGGEYLTHKAPTALLLKPDKSFFKFGFDAENEYARLSEDNDHKDYYFFHRFKLILKSNLEARVHRKTTCTDESGKELEALTIFTYCIGYLKDHLLDSINKKITGSILSSDIEFVITVPAIWDDTAKMFMREAAREAGINPNQLTIALEPEAASLYCQYMHFEEDKSDQTEFQDQLCAGWKYMVADLGAPATDSTSISATDSTSISPASQINTTFSSLIPTTNSTSQSVSSSVSMVTPTNTTSSIAPTQTTINTTTTNSTTTKNVTATNSTTTKTVTATNSTTTKNVTATNSTTTKNVTATNSTTKTTTSSTTKSTATTPSAITQSTTTAKSEIEKQTSVAVASVVILSVAVVMIFIACLSSRLDRPSKKIDRNGTHKFPFHKRGELRQDSHL